MTIQIRYETIKAVSYVMSTEETRYYLNGIHIKSQGKKLHVEATDGHRLVKITKDYGEKLPQVDVILTRFTVGMILKLFDKSEILGFDFAKETVHAQYLDATFPLKYIDGTFPNTDRVVPDYSGVTRQELSKSIGFNMQYFGSFGTSLRQFGLKTSAAKFSYKDDSSPVRLDAQYEGETYLGVLMPLRV